MEKLNISTFKAKVFDFEKNKTWAYKGSRPAIIDFYADWCGPCRALSPVLEELSKEYAGKIDIYKVDTEANPELASLFEVRGIPAILFVPVSGGPAMATGLMPKQSFEKAIAELFNIQK